MNNTKVVRKCLGLGAASTAVIFFTLALMLLIFILFEYWQVPGLTRFDQARLVAVGIVGVGVVGALIITGLHFFRTFWRE